MLTKTTTYSVFQEPWWLDATAPGDWDAVEVEEDGKVVARFPFVVKEKYRLRLLTQPQLTQTLGPWIEEVEESEYKRRSREKDLYTKLIKMLPKHDFFRQHFHPSITNWLPFYWEGFSQTTRYTYTLDMGLSEADLLAQVSRSARNRIRSAGRKLVIEESDDIGLLYRLASASFKRQDQSMPYSFDYLAGLDEAVRQNAQRRLFVAYSSDGATPLSASYTVGDGRRAYLLISGADPESRGTGAGHLTEWAAIQSSIGQTEVFDFEGSMVEGIEYYNRTFGANLTPYFKLVRQGRVLDLAQRAFRRNL